MNEHKPGWKHGEAAEWWVESFLANPSFAGVVSTVALTMALFIGLSWIANTVLGLAWLEAVFALAAALILIQGLPSAYANALSAKQWRRVMIPAWIARAVVFAGCMLTYGSLVALPSPARWFFLLVVSLLVGPIIWFALLQVRQSGIMAAIEAIRARQVVFVTSVALVQISLWVLVLTSWFWGSRIFVSALLTALVAAVHLGGNILIAQQLATRLIRE